MEKRKPLLFVTSNRHKFNEVRKVLAEYGIPLKQRHMDFIESSTLSIGEEARRKAKTAYEKYRQPLITEDTGFYFRAYKNFPGSNAKEMFNALGFDGLFRLLDGKPRSAFAKVAICHISSKGKYKTFTGKLEGKIAERAYRPSGHRMPYEHIFIPRGRKKPMVQMTRTEKNKISHRALAARKLCGFLS